MLERRPNPGSEPNSSEDNNAPEDTTVGGFSKTWI